MTTTLFKTLGAATTLAGIIATAGSASAATISYSSSTDFDYTDIIEKSINVSKFNSSLGTLKGVTLQFTGDITGMAGFENKSSKGAIMDIELASDLTLELDNILLSLNPKNVSSYSVTGYDGLTDYGGTSGRTIESLNATGSDTKTYTDSATLQSFLGSGNLNFLFSAIARSKITGTGSMSSYFDTFARTAITVTYDYDPAKAVPEPSALLGFGLFAGAALLVQRKKSAIKISNL